MHPQLTDKRITCKEFIEALEQCHSSLWSKFTGGCNDQKHALNMCLRKERVERSSRNRENAKIWAEKKQKSLEELHKDD